MDLNPIGKHCALQSCNVLDFLPIQCNCSQWFCKLHVSPELHDCSALQQHSFVPESSTNGRPKCALAKCNNLSLATGITPADLAREGESSGAIQASCPGCHLSFCVHHRHMQSHACPGLTAGKKDTKHEAARVILAQAFSASSTPTSHTPVVVRQRRNLPSDPQKRAQVQKVHLMKLRHRAVPADPKDKGSAVPVDQRLHVTVRLEITSQSAKEIVLWFRKATITGRALDLAVLHFGISDQTASALYLKPPSSESESQVLQNDLELSGQLEDGSTVLLTDSPSSI